MLRDRFAFKFGASKKVALTNTFLVANAFVWYLTAFTFLRSTVDAGGFSGQEILAIVGINFLGVGCAAFFGSFLIEKYKRRLSFLRYWLLAGVVLSLAPILISMSTYMSLIIVSSVLGAYFGIGIPICMGYFAAATEPGNRARTGGMIILMIGLGVFALTTIGQMDPVLTSVVLGGWRAAGLFFLILLKPEEKLVEPTSRQSYRFVVSNRSFLLYFIPWIMFSLVNDLTFPINARSFPASLIQSSAMIENILAGGSAVLCGFLADSMGRKRLTLMGFALLGLGYGALGFFIGNTPVWWFYTCVDGVAWGIFSMVFLITIWGDLAQRNSSEKYYILGSLPYLLSNFTRVTLGNYVASTVASGATVFSFASFFIFIAVLPLFYAPETLPEKVMKDRDLKSYVEKAIKKAQSGTEKKQKTVSKKPKKDDVEFQINPPEENDEEYEEAKKLAEEYY